MSPGVVLAALLYVNAVLFVAATFAPSVPRLAIPTWLSTGALFPALVALLLANLFLHRRRLAALPRGLLTFFAVLSLLALTRLPHLLQPEPVPVAGRSGVRWRRAAAEAADEERRGQEEGEEDGQDGPGPGLHRRARCGRGWRARRGGLLCADVPPEAPSRGS